MWIRVDDQLRHHPKFVGLSRAARTTLWELWGHCGEFVTDGFIPRREAHRAAYEEPGDDVAATLGELARAGFIHPVVAGQVADCARCSDRAPEWADEGYLAHDWLDWNPSRAEWETTVETEKSRRRNGGLVRASNATRSGGKFARRTPEPELPALFPGGAEPPASTSCQLVNSTSNGDGRAGPRERGQPPSTSDPPAFTSIDQLAAGENDQHPPAGEPAPDPGSRIPDPDPPRGSAAGLEPGGALPGGFGGPRRSTDPSNGKPGILRNGQGASPPEAHQARLENAGRTNGGPGATGGAGGVAIAPLRGSVGLGPTRTAPARKLDTPPPTELDEAQLERVDELRAAIAGRPDRGRAKLAAVDLEICGFIGRGGPAPVLLRALEHAVHYERENPATYMAKILRVQEPNHHAREAEARGLEARASYDPTVMGHIADILNGRAPSNRPKEKTG